MGVAINRLIHGNIIIIICSTFGILWEIWDGWDQTRMICIGIFRSIWTPASQRTLTISQAVMTNMLKPIGNGQMGKSWTPPSCMFTILAKIKACLGPTMAASHTASGWGPPAIVKCINWFIVTFITTLNCFTLLEATALEHLRVHYDVFIDSITKLLRSG